MIITHSTNSRGQRRVYLGGKSSLECWVEPKADGIAWSFHLEPAVAGNVLLIDDQRDCAVQTLLSLAAELAVAPDDLKSVPFERIAALHTGNPFETRRVAVPRSKSVEHCFMATAPNITHPQANYASGEFDRNSKTRS